MKVFKNHLNRLTDANSQLETEESTKVEAANVRTKKAKHELSEMEKRLKKATDELTEDYQKDCLQIEVLFHFILFFRSSSIFHFF